MSGPSLRLVTLVVGFLLTHGLGFAADPIDWLSDYAIARKEAEKKKLPLLIVIGTEQCVYCRKLESDTFGDSETATFTTRQFVALKIDANKNPEFARAMRVNVYPTTVIAGPDGKIYAYLSGYIGPDQFREYAKKALALLPSDKPDRPTEKTAAVASLTKPSTSVSTALVKAVGPADSIKPNLAAKELFAVAQAAFQGDRYSEVLDICDVIRGSHGDTTEAESVTSLVTIIKSDPSKLSSAAEQMDDKFAAVYLGIAEAWEKQGRGREAISQYEKVLRVTPAGKNADLARSKLATLYRQYPTVSTNR
jgi:thioredoxin-related protein